MKKALGFVFVASLALGSLACKDASKEIVKLADEACACADKACADGVLDKFVTFAKANKNASGNQQTAQEAGEKLGKCLIEKGVEPKVLMEKMSEALK